MAAINIKICEKGQLNIFSCKRKQSEMLDQVIMTPGQPQITLSNSIYIILDSKDIIKTDNQPIY